MFFPNEIITEIINISDYQIWIDKINKVNKQYHSYYTYVDEVNKDSRYRYQCLRCIKHGMFVVNWRNNGLYAHRNRKFIEREIHSICVDSEYHEDKIDTDSQIYLPHNY